MPRCPVCFVPMTRTEEDGLRGHTCPSCFGHWMPNAALLRRLKNDVSAAETQPTQPPPLPKGPPPLPASEAAQSAETIAPPEESAPLQEESPLADLAAIVTEADSKKPLRCPDCEKIMHKDRFQQLIPINVDRCKHCDRIWMDTGEFHLIRRLYVELATSTDPQIVQLREKVAAVSTAWHTRTAHTHALADSQSHHDPHSLTLESLFTLLRP